MSYEVIKTTQYLVFRDIGITPRKTKQIAVESRHQGTRLGLIQWYGGWRQYVFYPTANTVFNNGCLQDITVVLDQLMAARKAS